MFISKLSSLSLETRELLISDLKKHGANITSKMHFEKLGWNRLNLYYILQREEKRLGLDPEPDLEVSRVPNLKGKRPKKVVAEETNTFTAADEALLEKFKKGELGFSEMHKELAARVFEKILKNPESIKVRDWLSSELVKVKRDEATRAKDAMETFIDEMFSGFLPSPKCPHCGHSTLVKREELTHAGSVEITDDD